MGNITDKNINDSLMTLQYRKTQCV
uniref:Uncharacterized protein n=1 Tax=Anguilla anguilla TaxID=7936 RepID=A0A0E9VKR0_ANGAN